MILVAGTSASGKTTLLHDVGRRMPGLVIISASGVLREAGRPLHKLTRSEAMANQEVLLGELRLRGFAGTGALLDGHAVIDTTEGPMTVPDGWYDAIGVKGAVHIDANPDDIAARRGGRDMPTSPERARQEQAAEYSALKCQASRLSIPFINIPPGHIGTLIAWIAALRRPA